MALFIERTFTLDINQTANGTTDTDEFSEANALVIDVRVATGTFATAILDLECSANGNNWNKVRTTGGVAIQLTAIGLYTDVEPFNARHCRLIPTTGEGGVGTVTVIIQGKG